MHLFEKVTTSLKYIGRFAWTFFYPSDGCHELCINHANKIIGFVNFTDISTFKCLKIDCRLKFKKSILNGRKKGTRK